MTRNLPANPLAAIIARAAQNLPSHTGATQQALEERSGRKPMIVADVSFSMDRKAWGGHRRIDILREALRKAATAETLCIAFSTTASLCTTTDLPEPHGSTALHLALKRAQIERPVSLLVISDGEPDDEAAALTSAAKIICPIDTLYVGPEANAAAVLFMERLSRANQKSGRAHVHDITQPQALPLASRVAGLLPAR